MKKIVTKSFASLTKVNMASRGVDKGGGIKGFIPPPTFPLFYLLAFLPRDAPSAKRGIAIACRLSVRPSVTLVNCDHIGWNSSKVIPPLVSLGRSLFATPT